MPKRGLVRLKDESGVVTLVVALGMVALLGMAALALDIAHLLSVKNELQRVADAGAMAGARGLWPRDLPLEVSPPSNTDCATAQSRGLSVATHVTNKVDGGPLSAADVNLQVGRWDYAASQFAAGCAGNSNAVKVTARKTGVRMFFAGILGQGPMDLSATSTSVMDFARGLSKGALPIAINKQTAMTRVGDPLFITFASDSVDNGCWFADVGDGANARTFREYINYGTCPSLFVGDIITLQNGQDTAVLHDLAAKLAEHGGEWVTFLPVVDTITFNQSEPIVAFVPFLLTKVESKGNDKGVRGKVLGMAQASMAEPGGTINCGLLAPAKTVGVGGS